MGDESTQQIVVRGELILHVLMGAACLGGLILWGSDVSFRIPLPGLQNLVDYPLITLLLLAGSLQCLYLMIVSRLQTHGQRRLAIYTIYALAVGVFFVNFMLSACYVLQARLLSRRAEALSKE